MSETIVGRPPSRSRVLLPTGSTSVGCPERLVAVNSGPSAVIHRAPVPEPVNSDKAALRVTMRLHFRLEGREEDDDDK